LSQVDKEEKIEVGSMQITGTIDTTNIERGVLRIEGELRKVSSSSKSVQSDFMRIDQASKGLVSSLSILGTIGVGAMIGLAKNAPGTAAAMAGIQVATFGLTNALGNALAPAFEKMPGLIDKLTTFITDNQDIISSFSSGVIDGLTIAVTGLSTAWNGLTGLEIPVLDITVGQGLKWIFDNLGGTAVLALLGKWLGGKATALTGISGLGTVGMAAGAMEGMGAGQGAGHEWATTLGLTGLVGGLPFGGVGGFVGGAAGTSIGWLIDQILAAQNNSISSASSEQSRQVLTSNYTTYGGYY